MDKGLFGFADIAYFIDKKQPKEEHHTIEKVLEEVGMKEIEPIGVELGQERNGEYPEDIEYIDAPPPQGDIPDFVYPTAACGKQQAKPYKRLFEGGATPCYVCTDTRIKIIGSWACQRTGIAEKTDEPIDLTGDMACEAIERGGDVQSEPRNHHTALVTVYGEFPEIICHKQGNDKNDDVGVRREGGTYLPASWHFERNVNYRVTDRYFFRLEFVIGSLLGWL